MDVLARLDHARAECSVLEHPFYERWSAGELSAAELSCYAGEYRHAVVALAEASTATAAQADPAHAEGLRGHAAEETAHVELWDDFARATCAAAGIDAAAAIDGDAQARATGTRSLDQGLDQTQECARAWTAGETLLEHLAVLYAIEAGQPEISRTKLEGLTRHYDYSEEGPALEYFKVHELRDVEHARAAGALIEELLAAHDGDTDALAERMVDRANAALRGNWLLLDGVERAAVERAAVV